MKKLFLLLLVSLSACSSMGASVVEQKVDAGSCPVAVIHHPDNDNVLGGVSDLCEAPPWTKGTTSIVSKSIEGWMIFLVDPDMAGPGEFVTTARVTSLDATGGIIILIETNDGVIASDEWNLPQGEAEVVSLRWLAPIGTEWATINVLWGGGPVDPGDSACGTFGCVLLDSVWTQGAK